VIPGVLVYEKESLHSDISGPDGLFVITNLEPGHHTIVTSYLGYTAVEIDVHVTSNTKNNVEIYLNEQIINLPVAVVSSISMTGGSHRSGHIPGATNYITSAELKKFNYTDVHRILSTIPGVNIQEEDGFGLRPNIGLRGSGNERSSKITMMEDGILSAPAPYAAPAAYYFPSIGRMHAIEVIKGSSQIKYGPYTTGGAINFISTPIPSRLAGVFTASLGSFGTNKLHASIGNKHSRIGYLLETIQNKSRGFKQIKNTNTGFSKGDYLMKFRINTKPVATVYQSLDFKAFITSEKSNETYLGLSEDDFIDNPFRRYFSSEKDKMESEYVQFSLRHAIQFSKVFSLATTAYRSTFKRNWYKLDKVANNSGLFSSISSILDNPIKYAENFALLSGEKVITDPVFQLKANNRKYLSKGIQSILISQWNVKDISNEIELGIRYHFDKMDRYQWTDEYRNIDTTMQLSDSGIPGTESNRIESANAFAAYLKYHFKINGWVFFPGVRYENIWQEKLDFGKDDPSRTGDHKVRHSNHVSVIIPGIGIQVNPGLNNQIFVGIHKGFSPPGSNAGTLPEKSINFELGWRHDGLVSTEIILFNNSFTNLLGADLAAAGGQGSTDLFNGGQALTRGLEISLSFDPQIDPKSKLNLPVNIVYSHTYGIFKHDFESDFSGWGKVENGDHIPYISKNNLTLRAGLHTIKFNFDLACNFIDKMRTKPGKGPIPQGEGTDRHLILDFSARYHISPKISAYVSIKNLTDQVYIAARRPAGLRPGLPRTFEAGVSANL
jgi:Fe(3+) dicitrate transport protein